MASSNYTSKVAVLIGITLILRCYLATVLNLGYDASYYYTYALQPDWNHFDHPPLIGIFIRFFTFNLNWVNDFSMRLTAIVSSAIGTWLIYQCGILLKNERTGWIAAILYNTSIYTSFAAGFFILPDSPQLVFWLFAVYLSLQLVKQPTDNKSQNLRLLLLGIITGMATMCKVHGLFLWLGIGMFILLYDRKFLKNPYLYASILITLLIISPIYFWNLQNDFVTWQFHSERVEINGYGINLMGLLDTLYNSLIYFNPAHFIVFAITLVQLRRSSIPVLPKRLLLWLGLPIILATLFISLFREVLVHWSGPGYIALMILAGYVFDEFLDPPGLAHKRWLNTAIGWMVIFVVLGVGATNHYPGTWGESKQPHVGHGDITLERYGWDVLRTEFKTIRNREIEAERMAETSPIVLSRWYPGCHYFFYVARPLAIRVVGVGPLSEIHKFAWLNRIQGYVPEGSNAFYISTSSQYEDPFELYQEEFRNIVPIDTINLERAGEIAGYWYVYRLEHAVRELGHILPE